MLLELFLGKKYRIKMHGTTVNDSDQLHMSRQAYFQMASSLLTWAAKPHYLLQLTVLLFFVLAPGNVLGQENGTNSQAWPRFNSYEDLRLHQKAFGLINATVEFRCQLVFAGEDWTACFVETPIHGTMLRCTSQQSNELRKLPVGATIQITGHVTPESESVILDQLLLIDPNTRLEPLDLSVVNEMAAAKLNGLASLKARVTEVFLNPRQLCLFTWFGYTPHEIEIHDISLTRRDADNLYNQMIHVTGSLTRSVAPLEAPFVVRVMSREQILEPQLDKATRYADKRFVEASGQVLYSDSRRSIVVKVNNEVRQVSTRFAHRIKAGDHLGLLLESSSQLNDRFARITPAIIIGYDRSDLPSPIEVASNTLVSGKLPPRIRLKASVLQAQHLPDGNCVLKLNCEDAVLDAVVPTNTILLDLEGFVLTIKSLLTRLRW